MTYKCKDCGSEWWTPHCKDCGGEVYPIKGGVRFEETGKQTSHCAQKPQAFKQKNCRTS